MRNQLATTCFFCCYFVHFLFLKNPVFRFIQYTYVLFSDFSEASLTVVPKLKVLWLWLGQDRIPIQLHACYYVISRENKKIALQFRCRVR